SIVLLLRFKTLTLVLCSVFKELSNFLINLHRSFVLSNRKRMSVREQQIVEDSFRYSYQLLS
ncbi:hypothetical protein, partial [Bacillus sp. REN16]|uniref:hypothetical protein n=1 Tax=Bacillus sp. REN16 TaxID=2887296 RepID=UPI001E437284